MKKYCEYIFEHSMELAILLFSILVIAFMITGGCDGDGGQELPPGPTGPPPGCEPVVIDPECPAVSLTEFCTFWSYSCSLTEKNSDIPEPETIFISFNPSDCVSMDCFMLECESLIFDIVEIGSGGGPPPTFTGIAHVNGGEYDFYCIAPIP